MGVSKDPWCQGQKMARCRSLFALSVLCALGHGQGKPQLSLFEIFPCSEVIVEHVSRFKSDVYAVKANLSECAESTINDMVKVAEDNGYSKESIKIGLRVISMADVIINDTSSYFDDPVVFVGRQGNAGVVSWNIPLQLQGFSRYFDHVSRTMCPENLTLLEVGNETVQSIAGEFIAEEDDLPYLFFIDVFSSSVMNRTYSIQIEIVPSFTLVLDQEIKTTVGASTPQIFYFKFPDSVSAVTVSAATTSDKCAFLSVQNNTCPINDMLGDSCTRGIYQTMSKSSVLTVEDEYILNREFVVVLITTSYSNCHGAKYRPLVDLLPNDTDTLDADYEFAQNITVVIKKLEPVSTFVFAIFFPFLVFLLYVALVLVYIFGLPRIYITHSGWCQVSWKWVFPCTGRYYASLLDGTEIPTYSALGNSNNDDAADVSKETENVADTASEDSYQHIDEPDESKLMLPLMTKTRYSKLNKQYSAYSWNTITVGIFYALPAFQLVLSEQQISVRSGDQDKCYFNFKCSHPLGVLSSFNNVWSNIGYFLLGLFFIGIVYFWKRVHMRHRKVNRAFVDSHGIPQFFGIYQAMGIALILEGFMSAFYHICPTDANFQFDTAFMFIIGGLLLVKVFQNRHPDINANAFIAFFSFAVVIFMTLIGIYVDHDNPVAVRITMFAIVLIFVFIFFLSYYRFHHWSWDVFVKDVRNVKPFFTKGPRHKGRFFKLVLVFLVNIVLLVVVVVEYSKIDIATAVLLFFVFNLLSFISIYIMQKIYHRETLTVLPFFLMALLVALWVVAFYFFVVKAVTNWALTPSESRALNRPCFLLGFYDYHDVWHFFSASAMFFSFLFLLTLDDGLLDTRRADIHIF